MKKNEEKNTQNCPITNLGKPKKGKVFKKISSWGKRKDYYFPYAYKNVRGVNNPPNYLLPFYFIGAIIRIVAVLPVLIIFFLLFGLPSRIINSLTSEKKKP